jgi:hypothetical protein
LINQVEDLHQHLRILLHVGDDLIPLILRDGGRSCVHGLRTTWLDSSDLPLVNSEGFFGGSYPWGTGGLLFLPRLPRGWFDFWTVLVVE